MRIAQVAPPWITVPPAGYGGTEWVVKQVCDGLTERGHDVTLYATGDSSTPAHLRSTFPQQMPQYMEKTSFDASHVTFALDDILADGGYDLVHDHSGYLIVAFSHLLSLPPTLHTIHCAFDDIAYPFYERFKQAVTFNAISEYHRSQAPPGMNWGGVVYNAVDLEQFPYTPKKDDYLLAFGRIAAAKGFHLSIEAAKRTGQRLIMAGVVQERYQEYFDTEVKPHVDGEQIIYEGEVSDARKHELFAHARAFLFPITWPEPFGLVMIEAMATGTPVVALRQGSVPEVVDDGRTGFVCDTFEEFVSAVDCVGDIDPRACRDWVEQHFTVPRMVDGYEAIYRGLLEG
jgi:glycosyltransferase involved in cell wall biosynthesis